VLVLTVSGCSSGPTSAPTAEAVGLPVTPLNLREIPAPSLDGNLLGDPTEREVWIYLPPQYFESDEALPVVYYLPGFGEELVVGVDMPADLDTAFASIDPMIVVVVPGVTSVGGSFYVDSAANGDWESFVTQDVVEYVDANFRTLADAETRGIAGFSMGGFGALNLGMRHPDVFGAVYATAPGVLDEGGVAEMELFEVDNQIGAALDTLEVAESLEGAAVGEALGSSPRQFDLAYGLAFAPATAPPYLVYPFSRTGEVLTRDDDVWATWDAGFGDWDLKVAEFEDNLAGLSGLGFDCAGDDEHAWIPAGCVHFDALLTAAGIDHQYTVTSGGHEGGSGPQIAGALLPFMAEHLVGEPIE
jgi:S-formylglutathione hydrolase FrmB